MISVIIPFFQRSPGLLLRSVRSVLQQDPEGRVHIVITDDGSPVRAREELGPELLSSQRITLVEQANAGPGAARNRCLDALPPSTRYVALMDSDDIWLPGFLEHALPALALGVDIYFCDSGRREQPQSRFLWHADERLNVRAEGRRSVKGGKHLYWFEEPFFDFMLHRSNILGPSSTVYRLDCAPRLRFDPSLYNGQDRLFKIKLARTVRTVSFCDQVLCQEGEGVNIFDSAAWGSRKGLRLASSYISLHKKILGELDLDPAQTAFVRTRVEAARLDFAAKALHLISTPSEMDWTLFVRTVAADPRVISTALRHKLARLTENRRELK